MPKAKTASSIRKLRANDFDLAVTLESGQVFGWKKDRKWYSGEIYGKPVLIAQEGGHLIYTSIGKKLNEAEIRRYFSLDLNPKTIYLKVSTDRLMKKAVNEFRGLRLIRQDPWHCLVSFVCSSFSNIPKIEKNIESIKKEHGKKTGGIFLFPTIKELKSTDMDKLRRCGLGFRDKYVHKIADTISEKKIREIQKMEYAEAKKKLMEFPGIGEKVADCILLFSLGKGEAFPIDVWISRIMHAYYAKEMKRMFKTRKEKFSYSQIQEFARKRWGIHAGYAQQFLYMYARKHRIKQKIR